MTETDNTQPTEEAQPTTEVAEEIDGGNLPSARKDEENVLKGFEVTDEIKEKYFKNGKLFGRFENLEGMATALKSVEDKYANVMREVKSKPEGETQPEQTKPVADTNDVLVKARPLIDEYIQSGMELTDDIIAKAQAEGYDIRDIRLAAIDIKDKLNYAYNLVGGESEYKAMLEWGKANLDEKQQKAFDKDLATNAGEWAIKGLYAEYKSKIGSNEQPSTEQRIMGDAQGAVGIRPYASQAEILKDKAYINSPKGKNDLKALELYNKRMSKTPDSVVFGRA